MKNVVIGLFDNRARAQTVTQELIGEGFDRGDIHLASSESEFRNAVADTNLSSDETSYYIGEIRRGAAAVTVAANPDRVERAVRIMNAHKARIAGREGLGGERRGLESEGLRREEREMTFPVVEEELRIGKRMAERGGVRIYNRVTERPVEQQVNLREERIKVEHRPVDRPASEQDLNLLREGRQVDLIETVEEPVVAKEAHVVEEVVVKKEVVEHPETIRDTVRRTEVEVERVAGGESRRAPSQPIESGRAPSQPVERAMPATAARAQTAQAAVPNDLRRLKDHEGIEIMEGDIDPRGWDLIGRDGEKIGKIDGLIVSPSARKAYFALVNTGGWLHNKLFAIPLTSISFDRSQKSAQAPYLKKQFHNAPEYQEGDRNFQRYHDYWTGLGGGELAGAAGAGRR
ncbi:MAG TPA: DUF2382 domain-containing protein [Blastocatellia bacterium]